MIGDTEEHFRVRISTVGEKDEGGVPIRSETTKQTSFSSSVSFITQKDEGRVPTPAPPRQASTNARAHTHTHLHTGRGRTAGGGAGGRAGAGPRRRAAALRAGTRPPRRLGSAASPLLDSFMPLVGLAYVSSRGGRATTRRRPMTRGREEEGRENRPASAPHRLDCERLKQRGETAGETERGNSG